MKPDGFSWWTCSTGYDAAVKIYWLKLGPLSFALYRDLSEFRVIELHWMNRLAWDWRLVT